jgi:hypothetical protein
VDWSEDATDLLRDSIGFFPANHALKAPSAPWNGRDALPNPGGNDPPQPSETERRATLAAAGIPPLNADETLDAYQDRLEQLAAANAISSGPGGRNVALAVAEARAAQLMPAPPTTWDVSREQVRILGRLFGEPIQQGNPFIRQDGAAPEGDMRLPLDLSAFEWTALQNVPNTYWLDIAWPLYGRYLAQIRDTAATVGAPTVVLAIPHLAQVDSAMRLRSLTDYGLAESDVDFDRPQRDLEAQADRLSVPVLDLAPMIRADAARESYFFPHNTHFTARGSQVVASSLGDFLIGQHLIQPAVAPTAQPTSASDVEQDDSSRSSPRGPRAPRRREQEPSATPGSEARGRN